MTADAPASRRTAMRVRIRGRVQGVFFRGWLIERAVALGLDGWVRNRRDGSVDALFIGFPAAIEAAVTSCRQGPPLAEVSAAETEPAVVEACTNFGQRPTL